MRQVRIIKYLLASVAVFLGSTNVCYSERSYEMPPTYLTGDSIPVISDEAMEECVRVYNHAKWLTEEITSMSVNVNSRSEVNAYNAKVAEINRMTSWFNSQCAGKQSYSACEAANRLNRQNNRPTTSCVSSSNWRGYR